MPPPNAPKRGTVTSGAAVALVGTALSRIVRLLAELLLARFLGPAGFGLYAASWTVLRIAGVTLAPLGLDNGVIHFGTKYRHTDPQRLRAVLIVAVGVSLALGTALALLLMLTAPMLANGLFRNPTLTPYLRVAALGIPLLAGLRVTAAAVRVANQINYSVLAEEVVQPAVFLMFVIALLAWGLGAGAALASTVISYGVGLAAGLIALRMVFPAVFTSPHTLPPLDGGLLRFSALTAPITTINLLNIWVDRLIIGYYLPESQVGVYQAVAQISIVFLMILNAFNLSITPVVAAHYHTGDMTNLGALYRTHTRRGLTLSLPLFLLVVLSGAELIRATYGAAYVVGALPMAILAIGHLANLGTGAAGKILIMTGDQRRMAQVGVTALAVNIVLSILLTPRYGITGTAAATTIAALVGQGLLLVALWARHKISPFDVQYLKSIGAAVIAAVALALAGRAALPLFAQVGINMLVAFGVFAGALLLLGIPADDRALLAKLRPRRA